MSPVRASGPRWSVEKRYEFIEFRLFWTGRLNRGDLMGTFGLSQQQASADINTYLEGRKSNLVYDRNAKCYRRGRNFRPRFYRPDAGGFLAQLQAVETGLLARTESWIAPLPAVAGAPLPARGVVPEILREVYGAITDGLALEVVYQSMSRPEPGARVIEPHALAFDGFRWHARAFCRRDGVFKDFLLSRILEARESGLAESASADDRAWQEEIELVIAPHPGLSEAQARVFEMDYAMEEGVARIPVRRALLYYALKRLGLDTDPDARAPRDQQIVLVNRDEVMAALGG